MWSESVRCFYDDDDDDDELWTVIWWQVFDQLRFGSIVRLKLDDEF